MTRRVVKIPSWTWDKYDDMRLGISGKLFATSRKTQESTAIKPPYEVGDILWVRETWQQIYIFGRNTFLYKADPEVETHFDGMLGKWKPAIHMPREAARIFLKVTAVRAERLQDITLNDLLAEGFRPAAAFPQYWDYLNAKRGYSFKSNPWVWVVEFERIEVNE